jgi:hypothetical protein
MACFPKVVEKSGTSGTPEKTEMAYQFSSVKAGDGNEERPTVGAMNHVTKLATLPERETG